MSDRLLDVEGIGPAYATTLAGHGLTTTDDLLSRGARPAGRAELADATGPAMPLAPRAAATDDRNWFARLIDMIRGR